VVGAHGRAPLRRTRVHTVDVGLGLALPWLVAATTARGGKPSPHMEAVTDGLAEEDGKFVLTLLTCV